MARLRFILAAVAAVSFCGTPAAAQPPTAAGAARPKLQVLQALPEAQLFPLMNLIATSLGVSCDYCHVQAKPDLSKTPSNLGGWVWDSDDKAPKLTAREMMRMVVDLNASRFSGQSRVTCYTCHRGTTLPSRTAPLPPTAGMPTAAAPMPLPTADRVWTTYVAAVGDADNPAQGTGTIISGWDDRPEGRYGKVEIVISGPARYRATVTTPDGATSQGFDQDVAWVASNDRVQRLSGVADLARLRRIAMRYWPVKERPEGLRILGIDRVDDRDVYVAVAALDPKTQWTLYFDAITGLLRREVTTTETMLVPLQEQVDYDDYRDVDGVRLPFRVRTSDGAPYATVSRTFLQIRRNVPVDAELFRPRATPQ